MKIAVTYSNGEVFQHFGRTEQFKIYEIEEGKIVKSDVIGNDGIGHEALAGYLAGQGVEKLICGGLGMGAQMALEDAGIEVIAGAEGLADHAVLAYLRGELQNTGANCHEHDDDENYSGGCGGSCGSCGGGCHAPAIEGPNAGKNVKVHYTGTLNDGTKFDSSYDRGETLDFVCGAGMMIRGFDEAVATMAVGETRDIHLMPEQAYGPSRPEMIVTFNIAEAPGSEELEIGMQVYLRNAMGAPVPAKVIAKDDTTITFDANHEMAGKELNFRIELVEVEG